MNQMVFFISFYGLICTFLFLFINQEGPQNATKEKKSIISGVLMLLFLVLQKLFPGMVTFWFLTVNDMFHQYADALTNLSSFDFP